MGTIIKNNDIRTIEGTFGGVRYYIAPDKEQEIPDGWYNVLIESSYKDVIQVIGRKDEPVVASTPLPEMPKEDIADLNFVSSFWTSNGMGRVGEEVLRCLDLMGLKVNVIPVNLVEEGLQPRTLELLQKKYTPAEKTLFYSIPKVIPQYATKENYVHIPWDTTKAPDEWVEILNKYATKIYPCSDFTKKVFEDSGVTVPMITVKHAVNRTYFPRLSRVWAGEYRFLTAGDISRRKGTDILIKSFLKAFPKEKDVKLIIKSNHEMDWGGIKVPEDKRIQVIEETYSPKQYLDLMQKCQVYVAPSRAEGFGLPSLEAMSTGMAVILHNWGGQSIFANDKYNFPIGSGDYCEPDKTYPESYFEGGGIGKWREPDQKKLTEMMRYVYEQRDVAKDRAFKAVNWIEENWKWEDSVKKMWSDMNGSLDKTWGEFYSKNTLTKNLVQPSVNSHKELFWLIKGFKPRSITEVGTGTGEMSSFLSWDEQLVNGKEVGKNTIKEIYAIDNDQGVIDQAKINIQSLGGKGIKLKCIDNFDYKEKTDLEFSQGLLEHLQDDEARKFVDKQLERTEIVIHSVPGKYYNKWDFGNERLLTDEEWYDIFDGYDLTIYPYWEEDGQFKMYNLVFKNIKNPPTTSIIMACHDEKEMTINSIKAVRENTLDYELIVIDNGSTDGISEWLDDQKDLTVVHFDHNYSIPRVKNLAVHLARGKYICYLDNDTLAGKDWLPTLLSSMVDQTVGFTAHEGYLIDFPKQWFLGERYTSEKVVDWASTSVFLFPRYVLRLTGMLMTTPDLWNCEDVDFCAKLRSLGYKGKLPARPVNIQHFGSVTAKKFDLHGSEYFTKYVKQVWVKWEKLFADRELGSKVDFGIGFAPAKGYVHADIQKQKHVEIISDIKKSVFLDNSIQEVRLSHLLEHFTKEDARRVLKECYRILSPGGAINIALPDIKAIAKKFTEGQIPTDQYLLWTYGGQLDKYDYHYWGYDENLLKQTLIECGFENVIKIEGEWLNLKGFKSKIVAAEKKPKVGVYLTHHHIYGGGENCAMRVLDILQESSELSVISDNWEINPKDGFGINLNKINYGTPSEMDTYINFSHNEIKSPRAENSVLHIFYPQYDWSKEAKEYNKIIAISEFSKQAILEKWGLESEVIHPAVRLADYSILPKKKQILCVGRFFWVEDGNNKNQHILVEAFRKLKGLGWNLVFVGSIQDQKYFDRVKELSKDLDVTFYQNIPFTNLLELYAESKILWHGAGFGTKYPSGMEHFGMIAVEALASGCRALVFNGGGIKEIEGVETWNTIDELISLTIKELPVPKPDLSKYDIEYVGKQWKQII